MMKRRRIKRASSLSRIDLYSYAKCTSVTIDAEQRRIRPVQSHSRASSMMHHVPFIHVWPAGIIHTERCARQFLSLQFPTFTGKVCQLLAASSLAPLQPRAGNKKMRNFSNTTRDNIGTVSANMSGCLPRRVSNFRSFPAPDPPETHQSSPLRRICARTTRNFNYLFNMIRSI